jgi:hypothetical protein
MPTYICHGFRWPRPLIRIHIILQNLDDAAAEWLMAPRTAETMIQNLKTIYPDVMPSLPTLQFLEQYDPTDESVESKSQPYAYVCDIVHEVKLGIEFDEVRGKGVHNDAWTAMMDLRDKLAPGEKVSWFVVVCGDIERLAPPETNGVNGVNGVNVVNGVNGVNGLSGLNGPNGPQVANGHLNGHTTSSASRGSWGREDSEVCGCLNGERLITGRLTQEQTSRPSTSRSFKKIFGGNMLRKSKRYMSCTQWARCSLNNLQHEEHQYFLLSAYITKRRTATTAIAPRIQQQQQCSERANSAECPPSATEKWSQYHTRVCPITSGATKPSTTATVIAAGSWIRFLIMSCHFRLFIPLVHLLRPTRRYERQLQCMTYIYK